MEETERFVQRHPRSIFALPTDVIHPAFWRETRTDVLGTDLTGHPGLRLSGLHVRDYECFFLVFSPPFFHDLVTDTAVPSGRKPLLYQDCLVW